MFNTKMISPSTVPCGTPFQAILTLPDWLMTHFILRSKVS